MSKLFFRWLRGELNGYYINALNDSVNSATKEISDFLLSFKKMQFNEELDSAILSNIGKFASVFLPRQESPERRNSARLSESHISDGAERSERGLYDTEAEIFRFEHLSDSSELPDINTLATENLRSSLVGTEPATGYISSENQDVFDEEGNVKSSAILSSPPEGVAYSEYYGDTFLFLSEGTQLSYQSINPQLYLSLYKALQWIRYNGASFASFLRIVEILCPSRLVLITDFSVANSGNHYLIHYNYNAETDIENKEQRLFLLEYLAQMKFKQYILIQN